MFVANELKETANINKYKLRNSFLKIPVCGEDYSFKISGIGKRSIKLEKFFSYTEIIKVVNSGVKGFEFLIEQLISDPNKKMLPILENAFELKERALANKQNLKKMFINVNIGSKEYDFRIAGVGAKSVKLEIYVGYEDISLELNSGNLISLEFLLKEVIVGNEIDYDEFYNFKLKNAEINEAHESESGQNLIDPIVEKLPKEESEKIINSLDGVQKLIFDAIDQNNGDFFKINDLSNQDLIKQYQINEKIILEIVFDLINKNIIKNIDYESFVKLW